MTDKQKIDNEYWKKKYADIHIRLTNKIAELEEQLLAKEQECKELREDKIYTDMACEQLEKENKQLKAENEELEYIIANKSCLTYRDFKCTKAYYTDKRLKQTLQEIKEIAEAITNGTHFSDDVEAHLKEMVNKILEKISEVENG